MRPLRILVVDDDSMLGEQLRSLLQLLGHQVAFFADATRALEAIQKSELDLVFCDFWMPTTNGQTFYHQVSAQRPDLAPRIVFLTGSVMGDETQVFIKSTGNAQLLKPFKLGTVRQALLWALEPASAA